MVYKKFEFLGSVIANVDGGGATRSGGGSWNPIPPPSPPYIIVGSDSTTTACSGGIGFHEPPSIMVESGSATSTAVYVG